MNASVRAVLITFTFAAAVAGAPLRAQNLCQLVEGASVVAEDGKFLGKVTASAEAESILNENGIYGSKYGMDSIWNDYGMYGGEYGMYSPFNKYSATPPVLAKGGEAIAYLTVNKAMPSAVNPYILKTCEY